MPNVTITIEGDVSQALNSFQQVTNVANQTFKVIAKGAEDADRKTAAAGAKMESVAKGFGSLASGISSAGKLFELQELEQAGDRLAATGQMAEGVGVAMKALGPRFPLVGLAVAELTAVVSVGVIAWSNYQAVMSEAIGATADATIRSRNELREITTDSERIAKIEATKERLQELRQKRNAMEVMKAFTKDIPEGRQIVNKVDFPNWRPAGGSAKDTLVKRWSPDDQAQLQGVLNGIKSEQQVLAQLQGAAGDALIAQNSQRKEGLALAAQQAEAERTASEWLKNNQATYQQQIEAHKFFKLSAEQQLRLLTDQYTQTKSKGEELQAQAHSEAERRKNQLQTELRLLEIAQQCEGVEQHVAQLKERQENDKSAPTTAWSLPGTSGHDQQHALGRIQNDSSLSSFSQNLVAGLTQLKAAWNVTANLARTAVGGIELAVNGVSKAIIGAIDGTTTWGQAFAQVGRQIVSNIIQIAVQWIASMTILSALKRLFQSQDNQAAAQSASAWGAAAVAASIASYGAAAAVGTAAAIAGMTAGAAVGAGLGSTSYADGGFTGMGGKHEPAGIVHRGEWVMPQETVHAWGHSTMAAVQRGPNAFVSGNQQTSQARVEIFVVNTQAEVRRLMESHIGKDIVVRHVNDHRLDLGMNT